MTAGRHPMTLDRTVDAAVGAATLALVLTVALGVTGPVRVFLALGFMTFAPGWAVLDHVRLAEGADRVALAVVTSLTICAVVALGTLWLEIWNPPVVFGAMALLTLGGIVLHLAEVGR